MKKSPQDVQRILESIAKSKNTSVDEVRNEIQKNIDIAMENKDPAKRANMTAMIGHDRKPTVEEFLLSMAEAVKRKIGDPLN